MKCPIFLLCAFSSLVLAEDPSSSPATPEKQKPEETSQPKLPQKEAEKKKPAELQEKKIMKGHPFSWPFVGWEKMQPYGGTTTATEIILETVTKDAFTALQADRLSTFENDRLAILALEGDHRVSFDFIETTSSLKDEPPRRPYFSWTTEKAFVVENRPDFISIQHIMVMEFVDKEGKVNGPFTMKHWRQDWTYQDTVMLEFQGERTWKKLTVSPPIGTWTQAVYQVDDSPRYEMVGRWTHSAGLSIFKSQNFWRPLPRREFSVRKDYNILGGHHEITITPTGWLHSQFNRKIIAENGELKSILATEIGAVRYERITKPSQQPANEYWKKTSVFWEAVRQKWSDETAQSNSMTLQGKVDDRPMYSHLFGLAGSLESNEDGSIETSQVIADGLKVIDQFLAPPKADEKMTEEPTE